MKLWFVLVLLPLAYCASIEQRFLLTDMTQVIDELASALGSDYTEAKCESLCGGMFHLLGTQICPTACRGAQTIVNTLHGTGSA